MTSFPACSCVSPGMQRGEHARSARENGDRPGKHRPRRGTTGRSRVRRCRPTDGFSIRSKVSGDSIGRQRFLEVANGWPQSAVGALVPQHRGTVSGTQSEKPLSGDPAAFRPRTSQLLADAEQGGQAGAERCRDGRPPAGSLCRDDDQPSARGDLGPVHVCGAAGPGQTQPGPRRRAAARQPVPCARPTHRSRPCETSTECRHGIHAAHGPCSGGHRSSERRPSTRRQAQPTRRSCRSSRGLSEQRWIWSGLTERKGDESEQYCHPMQPEAVLAAGCMWGLAARRLPTGYLICINVALDAS